MRGLLVLLAVLLAIALAVRAVWPGPDVDPQYAPAVAVPTWSAGDGPAVLFDDGHLNPYSSAKGYAPLAALLRADGYTVRTDDNAGRAEVLRRAKLVVVANPLDGLGLLRQAGLRAGRDIAAFAGAAMIATEMDTLEAWVRNGGSLLLVADPAPFGAAAAPLAERFGVQMLDHEVADPDYALPGEPTIVQFNREAGRLGDHPILSGGDGVGLLVRVVAFGGQALRYGPEATPLLRLGPDAAMAVAVEAGRGRVVVLGDADLLSAVRIDAGRVAGLPWPDADNTTFARNVFRWLSRRDSR
jgi:hypothetical protein